MSFTINRNLTTFPEVLLGPVKMAALDLLRDVKALCLQTQEPGGCLVLQIDPELPAEQFRISLADSPAAEDEPDQTGGSKLLLEGGDEMGLVYGIYEISRRFLGSQAEAEDNVQDTLLRLWTIRAQLDEVRSVQALTYAICRNLCISKLRKRRIVAMELNNEIRLASEHDSQWMLEEKENAQWLEDSIAGLPAAQMQILRMSQQDGLENSEIAEVLGISETTVRTALCKARKNLLERLIKRNQ